MKMEFSILRIFELLFSLLVVEVDELDEAETAGTGVGVTRITGVPAKGESDEHFVREFNDNLTVSIVVSRF